MKLFATLPTGTEIKLSGTEWKISVNGVGNAVTPANQNSFILGLHSWTFWWEPSGCGVEGTHPRQLKLSRCSDGQFSCGDGDCVSMEERCDQVADCHDDSDEVDCLLLKLKKNYNKKVPPFTTVRDITGLRRILPVQLNISIDLLKIVDMEEKDHKIDFQFQISLEWRDNRVLYNNLKMHTPLNTLPDEDIQELWLPLVVYANTDQMEVTRLGMGWEWGTQVTVVREGGFTRTGLEVLAETEIFEGGENRLSMEQVYTWRFQCEYDLHYYPFDTQVRVVGWQAESKQVSRCAR